MAINTSNIDLVKPGIDEFYDVNVMNGNLDKIDAFSGDIINKINNGAIQSPPLTWGMNNKIQIPEVSAPITLDFEGFSCTNLLGSDGNCEDKTKWGNFQVTTVLDNTSKVIGTNSIKMTLTGANGNINKDIYNRLDKNKYYMLSAYLKNGNVPGGIHALLYTLTGVSSSTALVADSTKFVRVCTVITPAHMTSATDMVLAIGNDNGGTSGQYAYVDGVMWNEITSEDASLSFDELMNKYQYVDGHACLVNPMFENRRHNLVRNGNCEGGIGYWEAENSTRVLSVVNEKFQLVTDSALGYVMSQKINVRNNTNYYISGTISGNAEMYIYDANLAFISPLKIGVGTFNSGNSTQIVVLIQNTVAGTGIFNYIMLVEGTTAPMDYKSQDLQRFVVEGRFEKGDKVHFENKQISGLRESKYRVLLGKDYDWLQSGGGTGFKTVRISIENFPGAYTVGQIGNKLVKPDGSMAKEGAVGGGVIGNFNLTTASGGFTYNISNTDSGFINVITPNNDEVKAIMNGWQTINTDQSRYTLFCAVGRNFGDATNLTQYPPNTATLTSVGYTNGQTTLTVVDGSIFKAGDYVAVIGYTMAFQITSVSGNILTIPSFVLSIPTNAVVARCDNGTTDLRNLNYCKANIAPGYEGYRLTYKLDKPEPITDVNTHINGKVWDLVKGDNHIRIEPGIVLGEVANPITDTSGIQYAINVLNGISVWTTGNSQLRNMVERIDAVYKNQNYDPKWLHGINPDSYYGGKDCMYMPSADFDTSATYTVDYQILKSLYAQAFGSLSLSYRQSIINSINGLSRAVEEKQAKSSVLDDLISRNIYERSAMYEYRRAIRYNAANQALIFFKYSYAHKEVVPEVKVNRFNIKVFNDLGMPILLTLSDFTIQPIVQAGKDQYLLYAIIVGTNGTYAINNGLLVDVEAEFDCRRRI
jgi:hypothetical protein